MIFLCSSLSLSLVDLINLLVKKFEGLLRYTWKRVACYPLAGKYAGVSSPRIAGDMNARWRSSDENEG